MKEMAKYACKVIFRLAVGFAMGAVALLMMIEDSIEYTEALSKL